METKKWYHSKTIWGIVIAALGYFLNRWGVGDLNIPENADLETIKSHIEAFKAAQGNMLSIFSEVMAVAGSIIAILGRFKAEGKLTK
jgi:hypothetical protein